ncbi:RhoGEF domain-containing protein [Legionella drancourtii]|uniref:DH domain-containing protein n=1 Tax=Legionella drancourtii LLAP12 TaxID=658187 RepID=G9EJ73_9GAMM|nr:RhoGEF domain-containing protein [Legionella drancourtii]EHL32639.1 hypothetical protein LDG_5230 [Legionella drancourtii LLAP12]
MFAKTDADKLNPIVENDVFKEMVMTEMTYNKSLTLLDLILHNHDVNDKQVLSTIKPLVAALKTISDKLLTNVEEAVKTETTDGPKLREQRRQLITAFFNAYKSYAGLYQQFSEAYKKDRSQFKEISAYIRGDQRLESEENPELANKILELIERKKPLDLQAHLIQPIQRGPRYLLLLNATEKLNSNVDETNIQELKKLKNIVADFLFSVNANIPKNNSEKPYEFGDYSKALLDWIATLNQPVVEEQSNYQPGDLTKGAIKALYGFFTSSKPTPESTPASEQTSNQQQAEEHKQDDETDFTFI